MERKFKINEELFNEIFKQSSIKDKDKLKDQLYSLIEECEPNDKGTIVEDISESTNDDVFSYRSSLEIINLK